MLEVEDDHEAPFASLVARIYRDVNRPSSHDMQTVRPKNGLTRTTIDCCSDGVIWLDQRLTDSLVRDLHNLIGCEYWDAKERALPGGHRIAPGSLLPHPGDEPGAGVVRWETNPLRMPDGRLTTEPEEHDGAD
jgi:hypothetical protein